MFVKLWEERNKLNIQTNVKAYLYTSVKNICLNHIKRESFFSSIENEIERRDETIKTPREELEEKEIHAAVHNAINKLPAKCRQIFLMSKYDNLSYKEIAEIQNISINTVKTQLKRAFISLTKSLTYLRSLMIFIQFMLWYYINK